MLLDLSPLRIYRDYRLLFLGQLVSTLGTMISYVAVPYQVYQLTKSSFYVGLLGAVQVVPILLLGLWGGSLADRMDRRKLLLVSEFLMCVGTLGLFLNACLPAPSLWVIFALAGFLQAVNAFHRPAMEAITQKLVEPKHYGAVAALSTVRGSASMIVGPALGGMIMAVYGIKLGYAVDFATYFVALLAIFLMRASLPPEKKDRGSPWSEIKESLAYARRRPVLIGTYVVDIVAMTFAFPTALFPAMAEQWGGEKAAGILFSAMSIGALVTSVASKWTASVRRHGAMVVVAATLWGVAIVGFGFSRGLWTAVFFLACAGAADAVSAIFRFVIWNETIPNEMRGKLAGLEMISYMTGPLLGNMRAGWMAEAGGTEFSIVAGGIVCTAGVLACSFALPAFWRYRSVGQGWEEGVRV
jgi:MFS family permease